MSLASDREHVAIIGMAGRFPGAETVDAFWANLCAGVESIRPFAAGELAAAGVDPSDPDRVNAGAVMEGIDRFDASFFGIGRREAEMIDPQHRVFLETAWAAIEHAGYDPMGYEGRVGVFGGVAANTYFRHNVLPHRDALARAGDYASLLASEREYAITRVAYKLGLEGPAISVNTACSTSAVAVHLAVQSLLSGESDLALAGGARIRVPATGGYVYQEDGILSPDGHCRTFDAEARGTVPASGVAIVTLKRLSDALADADTIYAVVKGSAVNNDGATKVGFTAPAVAGQAAVIAEALAVAEVDADTIGMIEAHGTGTSLGDPIEVAALTQAFRRHTSRRQYCPIGSLKTNIGHLDAAAGVAGIIKAALSLHHERIPPSLNLRTPNPQIDFDSSPFFVNTELRPWLRSDEPRRAGVSSFGLGGTNAHVILEEAPLLPRPQELPDRSRHVITLSATTAEALGRVQHELADRLERDPDLSLAEVAFTLGAGRHRLPLRRSFVVSTPEEAIGLLRADETSAGMDALASDDDVSVAFLFPGQGAQYPGMGAGLYAGEAVFRSALEECARILHPIIGRDLIELIYTEQDASAAREALDDAAIAQPATFAMEYSLARLWMSWGIRPSVMVGHSLGEYAAACLGGIFTLEDALGLVAKRGRMMQSLPQGSMLTIMAEAERVAPLLDAETSLAAINAPARTVASGPQASIDMLEQRLADDGMEVRRLPIKLAAHSPMMDPMLDPFRDLVQGTTRGQLHIPMVSTVTGDWATNGRLSEPDYWARHLRETVRFSEAVGRLLERPDILLLEVGPGQTLTSLVRQHRSPAPARPVLASLPDPRLEIDDQLFALRTLGQAWAAGAKIDWTAFHGGRRRRVALPTYSFERERHWLDGPVEPDSQNLDRPGASLEEPAPDDAALRPASVIAQPPRVGRVASRSDRIEARVASILSELSGIDSSSLDPKATFIDLGFDSLFLTQANSHFRREFGVRITFRQLFEEAPSIESLAGFIDSRLPADAFQEEEDMPTEDTAASEPTMTGDPADSVVAGSTAPVMTARSGDGMEHLIAEQLRIMAKQLEVMAGRANGAGPSSEGEASLSAPTLKDHAQIRSDADRLASEQRGHTGGHYLATRDGGSDPTASHDLTEAQRSAIAALVQRSDSRTPTSKVLAQAWRPRLADNRAIVGFDQRWKELVYQIVSVRSSGSRIWDIDGNEYIDTALGFGTNLFGHSPDFVVSAVREQLERGYEMSVQNHLLGEVAEMAARTTGNERFAFTNSGGEAVETAIRIARTVTGREKLAYFTDDIHGRSDVVLGRAIDVGGTPRTVPMVAGIPQHVVEDALVLEYGSDRALDLIRTRASDVALVLVEPVRTRNPDLQPVEFLRSLRAMADASGFLLVFDEIVTGFRAHAGGVQAMFGVRADLTTYGKVLGGGLPIGVVAGESRFVDVIDGGAWSFGDDSFPEADITASGGTFIKHPLTLAASRAVLTHLEEQGPSLQSDLNHRTSAAVAAINEAYGRDGVPIHVEHFSSFFRPTFVGSTRFAGLFQYFLREQGVHSNPPSPSFLSTAHSESDVRTVVDAYIRAGREMHRSGLLEHGSRSVRPTTSSATGPAPGSTPVPVLPNVVRFLVERSSPDANRWNLGVMLRPIERLDAVRTRLAVEQLEERHDALRLRFSQGPDGWGSAIAPAGAAPAFSSHDLTGLPEDERRSAIEQTSSELQASLDLEHGPLFRMAMFDLGGSEQRLLAITHHFVMDGFSWRPFWQDFEAIYEALGHGEEPPPAPHATTFAEWALALQRRAGSDELGKHAEDWLGLPWGRVRPIPFDHSAHEDANTNESARELVLEFTAEETRRIFHDTPDVRNKTDLLMTALAVSLADWTGSRTVLFDLMGHGRDEDSFDDVDLFGTVGFFISYTPMVMVVPDGSGAPVAPLSDQIQPILSRTLDFDLLRYMASDATIRSAFRSMPRAQVLFNHLGKRDELDAVPAGRLFAPAPESIGDTHSPRGLRYYPMAISSQVWKERLRLNFVYSENLHDRQTVANLAESYKAALLSVVGSSKQA